MKRIPSFTAKKRSEVKLSELKRSKSNWSRYYTAQTDKLQVITIMYKKEIDKTRKKRKGEETKTLTIIVRDQEQIGGLKTMWKQSTKAFESLER